MCPEFTVLNVYFLSLRILNNLRLPWKQSCPEHFHCIEYSFHIQDFWATCACPEKQSVPWIHCIEYIFFIIQNFEQPALALKNRICPGIFHCIEIFLSFRIFEQLVLALKTEFSLNFSGRGGRRPPVSYTTGCHCAAKLSSSSSGLSNARWWIQVSAYYSFFCVRPLFVAAVKLFYQA